MAIAVQDRRVASPELRALMRRRLCELAALLLAGLAVAVVLALVSYNAADPSPDTAADGPVRNWAGPPGAAVADVLLQAFGLAAALPALALLAWAWRLATERGLGGLLPRLACLLGALPVLGAVCASLSLDQSPAPAFPSPAGPGGAIGRLLAESALTIGTDMLGPLGQPVMVLLGAAFGGSLAVLALGLNRSEWRAAARAARRGVGHGQVAAGVAGRSAAWFGAAMVDLLDRLNGTRPAGQTLPPMPSAPRAEKRERVEPLLPAAIPPTAVDDDPVPAADPEPPRGRGRPAPPPSKPVAPPPPAPVLHNPWRFPPLSLLTVAPPRNAADMLDTDARDATARMLESVLAEYGVEGQIVDHHPGPVVTLYELVPAPGIRSARVIGLADDIARSMSVTAVRIATVPGRNVIGIEVPNAKRQTVYLSELLASPEWERHGGKLALALGKTIDGTPSIAELARMPHLLVAGTTGSGKSVGINAMILSLLTRLSPDQCRLILIDPKMLELSVYDGIPHLLAPVVTEPAKAVSALKWTVREMERRYRAMSQLSVRNIGGYNDRVSEARARGEVVTRRVQTGFDSETNKPVFEDQALALEPLPYIVVVIDEMADLMMVAGKEIEITVQRLAQMARAAGIHVVTATQRPSVDVITGTIKANFPTRISFQVISKFDSRTILGEQGAEQLLGMGDMLYMGAGGRVTRVHGPFVSDQEVEAVVAFLREQGEPSYLDEVTEAPEEAEPGSALSGIAGASDGEKGLFDQAVDVVAREGKASTSFLQRHLNIGYNRAAKLIEQMEKEGIVGPANHVGKREVLTRRMLREEE